MAEVSRRAFLTRSTVAVAAAGLATAIPALPAAVSAVESQAPAVDESLSSADTEFAGSAGPIIAQVRDLSSGEIGIFNGTREVIYRDPQLALRLLRALR
jgi:hypothetical protein